VPLGSAPARAAAFLWEGVDGTRILLRRRNTDYVEGNFVLKGLPETVRSLHETSCLPMKNWASATVQRHLLTWLLWRPDPLRAGKPRAGTFRCSKAATIAAYNAQGWEYPRLVNASHGQFWQDIEAQIVGRRIQLKSIAAT